LRFYFLIESLACLNGKESIFLELFDVFGGVAVLIKRFRLCGNPSRRRNGTPRQAKGDP
jgi:hypothetical protein